MNLVQSTIEGEGLSWLEEKWRIEKIVSANIARILGEKKLQVNCTREWEVVIHNTGEDESMYQK